MTFASIKAFVKNHPWVFRGLLVLAVFAAGFGTAVVSHPAKVVEHTKTITVTKTVESTKTQDEKKVDQKIDAQKEQHVHRVVVETKKPDGTATKTTTEDVDSGAQRHEQTTATEVRYVDREVVKWQDRIVEKTVTKTSQPNWDARVGVGIAIPTLLGQPELGVPGLRGFVVEAGVDRRLVGPLWFGAFGNTQGTAGVDLRLTW